MTNVTQIDFRERNAGTSDHLRTAWHGASDATYACDVHSLMTCPEFGPATYILAATDASGARCPLRIAKASSRHGFENLAEIRFHAARLGADEVHVLAADSTNQAVALWDLQAEHFGALACEVATSHLRKFARV